MIGLETTEEAYPSGSPAPAVPGSVLRRLSAAYERFDAGLRAGDRFSIEDALEGWDGPERVELLRRLLARELEVRRARGERPDPADYATRFPEDGDLVGSVLAGTERPPSPSAGDGGTGTDRADDAPPVDASATDAVPDFVLADPGSAAVPPGPATITRTLALVEGHTEAGADAGPVVWPRRVGRYAVTRLLGEGGFGRVYLARDDDLGRFVAVKVPRAGALTSERRVEEFLREARLAASLKHPAIVTVHDVGRTDDGTPFVVMEYVEGQPLSELLRSQPTDHRRLAALIADVAEALHDAHRKRLVHRDLKPANLLIDGRGRPHVADFGLAAHEAGLRGAGGEIAGTPHYMAPEQVRGESHRLDGRTDLWGLGVVLYQVLTARLPFHGASRAEVFDAILHREPRPPRQLDPGVPRELERICLKCLSKRMTERYASALDLAGDLRFWLAGPGASADGSVPAAPAPAGAAGHAAWGGATSWRSAARVIPKGLRSYDAADSGFFPALLPGPFDRDGLPEGIRFWKARIEAAGPEGGFPVGLLYGPSGSGKSSLVQAGLLPNLAGHVTPVYVEAAPGSTEARLRRALRRAFPDLPAGPDLPELLLTLREGPGLRRGRKALLVIDQFEQWLHAPGGGRDGVLVGALRQCDGAAVQCLLMVRDDFGMAAMRFMQALEVPVVEGSNYATLDRFDVPHAAEVLGLFGRALGRLPAEGPLTTDQRRFLDRAAAGMSEDGKVAPLRLALFAEMFRGGPWNEASLKRAGGAEGLGVAFLDAAFGPGAADPRRRGHAPAARAVLKALLPDAGVNIRGHVRADAELLAASGYSGRTAAFEELIAVLDGELRLITPCEPERDRENRAEPHPGGRAPGRWFQLTHDYLVPSLRKWLTRKQTETARGRAELLLDDRAAVWSARPERRYLPSLAEWVRLAVLTRRADRTAPQRRMMRSATAHHAARIAAAAALALTLAAGVAAGVERVERDRRTRAASALAETLLVCRPEHLERAVAQLAGYDAALWSRTLARAADDPRRPASERTRAHLALLPGDAARAPFLAEHLLGADPVEHEVIRRALGRARGAVEPRLWDTLARPTTAYPRRVRAAAALAEWSPDDPRWRGLAPAVARGLAAEPLAFVPTWSDALRRVGPRLAGPLEGIGRDGLGPERLNAAVALRTLGGERRGLRLLTDLLRDVSDPGDFRALVSRLAVEGERVLPAVRAESRLVADPAVVDGPAERLRLNRSRANAAVALARLGEPEVAWSLLRGGSDPTVRDLLIHRLAAFGVEPSALRERLAAETDPAARQALLLALGEPSPRDEAEVPDPAFLRVVEALHAGDPDPGVHAAAEWVLRRRAGSRLVRACGRLNGVAGGGWSVNSQGQTMVHVRAPVEFLIGSRPTDPPALSDRNEPPRPRRIERPFAVSAHEVTVAEFLRYDPGFPYDPEVCASPDGPITKVSWYDAVRYCRWLSEREGVTEDQMCYPPLPEIGPGMTLPPNFPARTGYRLPTEAEWEYAARGGTATAFFFGEDPGALRHYAWYAANSDLRVGAVGLLKPNPLGLFDVYGNAREWCHDAFAPPARPAPPDAPVRDAAGRVNRGGGYRSTAGDARSSGRESWPPTTRYSPFGFRIARTLPR